MAALTWINAPPAVAKHNSRMGSMHLCGGRRHSWRRPIGLLLIASLMWTQFAVAAYACPAMAPNAVPGSQHAMPDCDGMHSAPALADADNPNLCLQHCLQGAQTTDHGQPAHLAPPVGAVLAIVSVASPTPSIALAALERSIGRSRPPPKTIAHCCLRI